MFFFTTAHSTGVYVIRDYPFSRLPANISVAQAIEGWKEKAYHLKRIFVFQGVRAFDAIVKIARHLGTHAKLD